MSSNGWNMDAAAVVEAQASLEDWCGGSVTADLEVYDDDGNHMADLVGLAGLDSAGESLAGRLCLRLVCGRHFTDAVVRFPGVEPGTVRIRSAAGGSWSILVDDVPMCLLLNDASVAGATWPRHAFVVLLGARSLEFLSGAFSATAIHAVGLKGSPDLMPLTRVEGVQSVSFHSCLDLDSLHSFSGAPVRHLRLWNCPRMDDLEVVSTLPHLVALVLSMDPMRRHNVTEDGSRISFDVGQIALCPNLEMLGLNHVALEGARNFRHLCRLESLDLFSVRFDQQELEFDPRCLLTDLRIAPYTREDIAPLQHLNKLENLSLSGAEDLKTLAGLEQMPNLKVLRLSGLRNLESLAPLSSLVNLEILEIEGAGKVGGADALSSLQRLTRLEFDARLEDVGVLQGLTRLRSLSLSTNEMRDLSFLTPAMGLQSLQIQDCPQLSDIGGLATQPRLDTLKLSLVPALSNFAPISRLEKLVTLDMWECAGLENLDFLADAPDLRELQVENCRQLASIEGLRNCTGLRSLVIQNCPLISDLTVVGSLTSLESLTLVPVAPDSGEVVKNIRPDWGFLASCTQLRTLDLLFDELLEAEILARCATARRDARFIQEHSQTWLKLLCTTDDPTRTTLIFLKAFAVSHGTAGRKLVAELITRLGTWTDAAAAAEEHMKGH